MTLKYLLLHRTRHELFSHLWFRCWGKRLVRLPSLVALIYRNFVMCARGANLGELVIVEDVVIRGKLAKLTVGRHSFIGGRAYIALHDNIVIGNNVVINEGVRLLTGSHDTRSPIWEQISSEIKIGDFAWIAAGAIILPGVVIGKGSVVGAGSVVTKDVGDFEIVAGNPARVVGRRVTELEYSPVKFSAPFEAWIGR